MKDVRCLRSVGDGGFDGDVAIDLNAASEFLVGFEFVEILKKGARIDVFKWLDFYHAFSAQAVSPTVQEFVESLIDLSIVIKRGLSQVGPITSF